MKKVKKFISKTTNKVNKWNYGDDPSLGHQNTVTPQQECNTVATGVCSHAEGNTTQALAFASHAEGSGTIASGDDAHAEGENTRASGVNSHSEGTATRAEGSSSHAEGLDTIASGNFSHAEGDSTQAIGEYSHAEGRIVRAENFYAHAEGLETVASGLASHAEGDRTRAQGRFSHAEGEQTQSIGENSHAEGLRTAANGFTSHAEGIETNAAEEASHAEGNETAALGFNSHSEGFQTRASGDNAHAEGRVTRASGDNSHAEGNGTRAAGINSHAEGFQTQAAANNSHAEGRRTIASGVNSHAEGHGTSTFSMEGAHIMGRFGRATNTYSWHLANGTSDADRSIAAIIRNDGTGIADNGWVTGNADFAEMFETLYGKHIEPGYFVTLKGDKIRKATQLDKYILGVTSSNPAFLADAEELRWKDKYLTDEWGNIKYKKVIVPPVKDKKENVLIPERTEMQPELNPKWDNNKQYIPRSERKEWSAVALMGKILIRDDGSCKVDEYCMPNNDGIATASQVGYRVLKRTGKNQILILLIWRELVRCTNSLLSSKDYISQA
jgi:trimeric autotransporter adhesin